jgi:hypothetical protein
MVKIVVKIIVLRSGNYGAFADKTAGPEGVEISSVFTSVTC